MQIVRSRKAWFSLSGLLVAASIVLFAGWGLRLGVDFTGGSLLQVQFTEARPSVVDVTRALGGFDIGDVTVQPSGEADMILRFQEVDEKTHQEILATLDAAFTPSAEAGAEPSRRGGAVVEQRFDSIGPIIGQELKTRTVWAIVVVLLAIIAYVAWAFRKVSQPVSSWRYGLVAIVAVFHDILIVLGVFSLLGLAYGLEVNAPFVAALLTILGYSVNDTIVVFDRLRENLSRRRSEAFEDTVERSLHETLVRSINTSVTTLLVLLAILAFGGETLRAFMLALIMGVIVGTYSSIFLASPLLVQLEQRKRRAV